jgi:hypothetical protein
LRLFHAIGSEPGRLLPPRHPISQRLQVHDVAAMVRYAILRGLVENTE